MPLNNNISFGRYLKSVRLSKGISIQEIADESRVSSDTLINIENEDHSKLPSEVYVKGFLRAYANYVGADGDRVIETYVQNLQNLQGINDIKLEVTPSGETHWGKLFLSICVLFCIVGISVFLIPRIQGHSIREITDDQKTEQKSSDKVTKIVQHEDIKTNEVGGVESKSNKNDEIIQTIEQKTSDVAASMLVLKIKAIEETWLRVTVDDNDPREYTLKPEDRIEIQANSEYKLFIGNAGGVILNLNEKTVTMKKGGSGEVVYLKLP
ncbi:MAG: DUF4115 domain-containing protein [Desulfobacterales bacterium]|nr:DUF4115 domain-containing protein [Desulfobacterales bacterium]